MTQREPAVRAAPGRPRSKRIRAASSTARRALSLRGRPGAARTAGSLCVIAHNTLRVVANQDMSGSAFTHRLQVERLTTKLYNATLRIVSAKAKRHGATLGSTTM